MSFRSLREILLIVNAFFYDLFRYRKFSSKKDSLLDDVVANYFFVKMYHRLEKSLSYSVRKPNSAWSDVELIVDVLKIRIKNKKSKTFHEERACKIVGEFVSKFGYERPEIAFEYSNAIKPHYILVDKSAQASAVLEKTYLEMTAGVIDNPELFFKSRYSLREFSSRKVGRDDLKRVIELALKSPSVCNRQAWKLYCSNDSKIIQSALRYQNGNRGFSEKISNLLVVCSDLKAFEGSAERYQGWIDGGLFSMGLVLAFHSLGISSCCLNWCVNPTSDREFRRVSNIKDDHNIVMMIAFGYPNERNLVCTSQRVDPDSIIEDLLL